MSKKWNIGLLAILAGFVFWAWSKPAKQKVETGAEIKFSRQNISKARYESVGVFDVNNDGKPDIVSGADWYEGPAFTTKHFIYQPKPEGDYFDDFSTLPLDVNGDGYIDIVTGGWFGQSIFWLQNPGKKGDWTSHEIAHCGNVETTRLWDVDGDGFPDVVPNTPNFPLAFYRLKRNRSGKGESTFTRVEIAKTQGHGLGFGDINGDGRKDFILSDGWIEAPVNRMTGQWIMHNDFELGTAGVPIIVADVNKDGKNDLIVGQAHSYGLDWYEQTLTAGRRGWIKHSIDSSCSQFHEMHWEDINGDGQPELITGKRYWAHADKDPGSLDPVGLYYYSWNGHSFNKHIISLGPAGVGKGTGICMDISDLRASGRKDIIVAGKDGLSIFFNEGKK